MKKKASVKAVFGLGCLLCATWAPTRAAEEPVSLAAEAENGNPILLRWSMGPFVKRSRPVLSPTKQSKFRCPVRDKEVRWEEQNVYNPAAVVRDGKVYLFYRADDRSPDLKWGRTCRIGLASSDDGIHFARNPTPVVYPDNDQWKQHEWEGGCEDLHIVQGEDGAYYMNYTTWNGQRDTISVASSRDLVHWTKHGPAFRKAGSIRGRSGVVVSRLVEGRLVATKINGKYWMYYTHPCALAHSDNLIDWTPTGKSVWSGEHEAGAIALLREKGILLFFNSGKWPSRGLWTLGQALIDRQDLTTVLEHPDHPFLFPEHDWETTGFIERTTVANTLAPFKGRWLLYYGAADRCIGLAEFVPEADSPFTLAKTGPVATPSKGAAVASGVDSSLGESNGIIDLRRLLKEMLDRSRIAEFPQPEFVCRQASSYNRRSQTPGTPDWFAGADFDQFSGVHEVEGRREWIMLDAQGPGVVTRWWQTQYQGAGTIHIYLDRSGEPIFEGPGDQLVGGDAIVASPLASIRGGGRNLYLPIPFHEHCRITYESPNADADFTNKTPGFTNASLFYNINYLQYPAGTGVKTLTRLDLGANQELLGTVGHELLRPGENSLPIQRTVTGGSKTLKPGQTLARTVRGSGAIALLRLKLNATDIAQALRSTVFTAAFDGRQTVHAPFHAQPVGQGNWGTGYTTNGRVRIHDRIPFRRSFQLNMELFHWQPERKIDYATTTHWYAFGGAKGNGHVTPEKVREKVAQTWVGPDDVTTKDTP